MRIINQKYCLFLIFILQLSCVASGAGHGQRRVISLPPNLLGAWELSSIISTSNAQGPSGTEQKALLGTPVVYKTTSLHACDSAVSIYAVETKQVSANEFLYENSVSFENLGISQKAIERIVINNRSSGACFEEFPIPGQVVYLIGSGEALISFEGVLYRAKLRSRSEEF